VGLEWDHPYDTRDEDLRKEFVEEVEATIRKVADTVAENRRKRNKSEL
jgi:hypothetical protein